MNGRELMLGRIRAALADVPPGEPPAWDAEHDDDPAAAYHRDAPDDAAGDLFAERCGSYRAAVTRVDADGIATAIDAICARHHVDELIVAPGLDLDPMPAVRTRADEPPLARDELDRADGVLTGCGLAIAQTGTIVLDGGAGQGRRALTLVPDLHICIVRAEQIVAAVPEAVAHMHERARAGHPITLISGPSATSDIELKRVEGVHGPRRLEVVLVG